MIAVLLALCAGMSNALATILERIGIETSDAKTTRGLMSSIMQRPVWFAGLGFMTASFVLQAVALGFGALSVVQPIQVTELIFLLGIFAFWFRRQLGWKEWAGALLTAVGLGVFLAVSAPTGGNGKPGWALWSLVLIASAGGVVLACLLGAKGHRYWRAAWYGVAGGLAFAMTAAFMKVSASYAETGGLSNIYKHWQLYAVAGAGLVGLVISQRALQAGPVAASQTAVLIVNPVASILIGALLFGDRLQTSRGREAIDVLALVVMSAGLFLLSHSPLIVAGAGEEHLSAGRPPKAGASPGVRVDAEEMAEGVEV